MKSNELKNWATRFVTIGLMTLVTACGGNNQQPQPGPIPPGGFGQGQVGCVPISPVGMMTPQMQPGQPMPMNGMGGIPFQAHGAQVTNNIVAFGRMPNGQSIGQVAMGGAMMGFGGQVYTGRSNFTGSTISIALNNANMMGQPGFVQPGVVQPGMMGQNTITGSIMLSQMELNMSGLMNNFFMMPGTSWGNQGFPQNGTNMMPGMQQQACVSGVGASGGINTSYGVFYGGQQDYVYVWINNGQTYIRFKI